MKLYTRSGDDGTTGLFGGQRVGKDDPRVEAYGTVDELNAAIGLAVAACDGSGKLHQRLAVILGEIQSRLFDLGADLATPAGSPHRSRIVPINEGHVREAESWIDDVDGGNEPMRSFVLPGGTELAARLHVARAVCRRAERRVMAARRAAELAPEGLKFLNRLGDLLFAMARRANKDAGMPDVPWAPGG
jgi:cob(I)alamin adenosyltransferase